MTLPVVLLTYLAVLCGSGVAGPTHSVDWITYASPITFISAGGAGAVAAAALVLAWRSSRSAHLFVLRGLESADAGAGDEPEFALGHWSEDRYLYAPSFGWSLALAVAAMRLPRQSARAQDSRRRRWRC